MTEDPPAPTPVPTRVQPLLERLAADARVLGVALLLPEDPAYVRLIVAVTHDGLAALRRELPQWARLVLGAETAVRGLCDGDAWHGLAADGARLDIELLRMSDLAPRAGAPAARPLLDPTGCVAQWIRWSANREPEPPPEGHAEASRTRRLLRIDDALRALATLPPGGRRLRRRGGPAPLRHPLGARVRELTEELDPDDPVEAALLARVRRGTRALPLPGEGVVVEPGENPDAAMERFLALADAEGFRGDRPLFTAARVRLAAGGTAPVFDGGFLLPTFDAVEARFALGEPVGGCRPPLVPGVLVGVGVTPRDHLEFHAAPCVREALASVACVDDDGERTVLPRDVGRDALLGALCDAADAARDRLPDLLATARTAGEQTVADVPAELARLHLPRSLVDAIAGSASVPLVANRLMLALSAARAAEDMMPLPARQLGRAAGRLLRETT